MKKFLFLTIAISLLAIRANAQVWTQLTSGTSESLLSIHFPDDNTGYVVGANGTILKTTDSGATWGPQFSGTGSTLYSTFFTDVLNGWAVGDNSTVLATTDGGANWNPVQTNVFTQFRVIWFLDANTGFIAGGSSNSDAVILKTSDGGVSWTPLTTGTFQVIYGIFFTDASNGYATDFDGKIIHTSDGGSTWSVLLDMPGHHLNGIYFTDALHGHAVGRDLSNEWGAIFSTSDGGLSWWKSDYSAGFLSDIRFTGTNTGVIVGGNVASNSGFILKTTDAGATWNTETTNPANTSRQFRAFLSGSNTGFSCGLDGTIFKNDLLSHTAENPDWSQRFNIFPNPTIGELTLEFKGATPKAGTVQIFDLLGRTLHTETLLSGQQQHQLSMDAMPAGVYFVKVLDDSEPVWIQKVVKQ